MANCHQLFLDYNKELNLTKAKRDKLIKSKKALREKIQAHFKEEHPEYTPLFFIQGSYKMKNLIRTKDDECDVDDGIYFKREPDVTGTTLQNWVYDAVEGHTAGGQQHRKKCIRVIYAGDYHIDLPVYYQLEDDEGNDKHPQLAIKKEGWQECDPKEFVDWFKEHKTDQIVRISKYLKGWGDHKRNHMPSGVAMTVLAEKNIKSNDRDDIAPRDSLKAIKKKLSKDNGWKCIMPTTPKDDLFTDYDDTFKTNFFKAIDSFIEDAKLAIDEDCLEKASKMWKKHLGDRFPIGEYCDAKLIGEAEKKGSLIISTQGKSKESGLTAKSKGGVYNEEKKG